MMKQLIILFVFCLATGIANGQDDRFEEGNTQYSNGDFQSAIDTYKGILSTGVESGDLYFNLGNAFYKNGELASAILNYERALLLKPHDKDIKYNLELAYSQTTDKIESVDEFFLSKWVADFRNKTTSDTWAFIGLACFMLTLVMAALFFFSNSVLLKKAGFYLGVGLLLGTLVTLSFSYRQKTKLVVRNHAIVFNPSLTVKSSPDASGTEIFILHEGTKVEIISTLGQWKEIQIADGTVGWVEESSITVI
ncbi:tetratricopeptide repeat protein [Carboxylicivirga sediminis]|uniref:Tetratricopeptide repeat protein n=1 Tax=Carboxylicivirga sediminis TaxID=2006564 RepID=A0A941IW06_9BACT|nr:tetratricopeptide repeat protein [Carboxylicivirga sediminis]MBR8534855.1 tetratricopeptide repeat protein [Carboxylicivirga sediminis]